ncbi:Ca(2+)-dependent cysteine protease [Cladochytrium tenue]|nr:Ca(2+)-dependent cysteine protease [Cladochytrium tenue]
MAAPSTPVPSVGTTQTQARTPICKALLIGILYKGTTGELHGSHNDVHSIVTVLENVYHYDPSNILILTEDQTNKSKWPTRRNILHGLKWLVEGAQEGDHLFLHFSGHGGSAIDNDGDESDGIDEVIFPLDYKEKGGILDDDLYKIAIAPLPADVHLVAVFDCCHSGSALDLQYSYDPAGNLEFPHDDRVRRARASRAAAGASLYRAYVAATHGNVLVAASEARNTYRLFIHGSSKKRGRQHPDPNRTTKGIVVMLSACRDANTTPDSTPDGRSAGAMSNALLTCLHETTRPTLLHIMNRTREITNQEILLSTGSFMKVAEVVFTLS